MNNKKKSNKKKLIAIGVILAVFSLVIYLFLNDGQKSKREIVNCNLESKNLYAKYVTSQRVEYVNDIFYYLELEQRISFRENALKSSLEETKEKLDSYFDNEFKKLSNEAQYYVKIESESLVFGYKISSEDYQLLELERKDDNSNLFSTDGFYDDKIRFINQIIKQGGECIYE